jgi:hypothetical protein
MWALVTFRQGELPGTCNGAQTVGQAYRKRAGMVRTIDTLKAHQQAITDQWRSYTHARGRHAAGNYRLFAAFVISNHAGS